MSRNKLRCFPIALVLLAALACGPFVAIPPTQTPLARTATPTVAGQPAEGSPAPGGGAAEGGDTINLDDPALYAPPTGVQTYRSTLDFSFDGVAADGTPVAGTVRADGAHQADPLATSLHFVSDGAALLGGPQSYVFTQIGDTQYVVTQDTGCITSSQGQQQNPFATFLDGGGFLAGQAQRVLPDETVNGVNTAVYMIDASNLDPAAPTSLNVTEITEGRIYLAQPDGYVVRMLIEGVGTSDVLSGDPNLAGNIHYHLDFLDFNQPVDIAAPPQCAATGPANFPTLDDAYEVASAGGLYSYKTNHTFAEAVAFYRNEMPAAGWSQGVESADASPALLLFSRGAEQATITIGQENGFVTVAITSATQ